MKKILNLLCGILVIAVVLSSCKGKVPSEAKYIPKDASSVLILDPEQMEEKLKKGGISVDTLINRFFAGSNTDAKDKAQFLYVKDSAGVNWDNKWVFFMRQRAVSGSGVGTSFTLLGSLKEAAKFESFMERQLSKENGKIVSEKEYKYAFIDNREVIIAWNKDHVTATLYMENAKPVFDSTTQSFRKQDGADKSEEAKKAVALMFTQKTSESLADVKIFTDMFKEKADGYMYGSTAGVVSMISMLPFQPPKLEPLLKDNYTTGTLTFEDGRVVCKGTAYPNAMMSDLFKKYPSSNADLSMLEHYPSQHVNGFMLFSFNPELIGGVMKQLEVEGMANSYLSKMNVTSEDLYKSLKGQVVLAVSDITIPTTAPDPMDKTNEKNMVQKKPGYKMVFNATVGDKTRLFKLLDMAASSGFLVKNGETYKGGAFLAALGMYVQADAKNFVLASDSLTYAQYVSKSSKITLKKDVMDKIGGKAGSMYFDIASMLNAVPPPPGDDYDNAFLSAKNTFKDLIFTFDTFDGTKVKSEMELRLQNEKENSLVTFVSLMSNIAADMRAKAKRDNDRVFPGGVPAIIRTN